MDGLGAAYAKSTAQHKPELAGQNWKVHVFRDSKQKRNETKQIRIGIRTESVDSRQPVIPF